MNNIGFQSGKFNIPPNIFYFQYILWSMSSLSLQNGFRYYSYRPGPFSPRRKASDKNNTGCVQILLSTVKLLKNFTKLSFWKNSWNCIEYNMKLQPEILYLFSRKKTNFRFNFIYSTIFHTRPQSTKRRQNPNHTSQIAPGLGIHHCRWGWQCRGVPSDQIRGT